MPCIATAALAASLTMASAVASSNGINVERLDVLALPSIGWAEWPRRHPAPAPMSVAEAISRLGPGLLVATWR